MLPKDKGTLIEHQCIVAFLKLEHHISVPVGESCSYDFILDVHGRLYKIQCKSYEVSSDGGAITLTFEKNVSTRTQLRTTKYRSDEVDFFCTFYNDHCYMIPYTSQRCKTLRITLPKRLNQRTINWAVEYEAEYVLNKMLNPEASPRIDMNAELCQFRSARCPSATRKYRWITDGVVNRRLPYDEAIPAGFYPGRTS